MWVSLSKHACMHVCLHISMKMWRIFQYSAVRARRVLHSRQHRSQRQDYSWYITLFKTVLQTSCCLPVCHCPPRCLVCVCVCEIYIYIYMYIIHTRTHTHTFSQITRAYGANNHAAAERREELLLGPLLSRNGSHHALLSGISLCVFVCLCVCVCVCVNIHAITGYLPLWGLSPMATAITRLSPFCVFGCLVMMMMMIQW